MNSPTTVALPGRSGAKKPGELLRVIDSLRVESAELMREVFPGNLKRYAIPNLPESTISKAREGYVCSAFFRASLYILALRLAGARRERAQRLVDRLQDLVNKWWPADQSSALEEMLDQEGDADAEEDRAEMRYLLNPNCPERRAEYLAAVKKYQALLPGLIQTLEAEGSSS